MDLFDFPCGYWWNSLIFQTFFTYAKKRFHFTFIFFSWNSSQQFLSSNRISLRPFHKLKCCKVQWVVSILLSQHQFVRMIKIAYRWINIFVSRPQPQRNLFEPFEVDRKSIKSQCDGIVWIEIAVAVMRLTTSLCQFNISSWVNSSNFGTKQLQISNIPYAIHPPIRL